MRDFLTSQSQVVMLLLLTIRSMSKAVLSYLRVQEALKTTWSTGTSTRPGSPWASSGPARCDLTEMESGRVSKG